MTQLTQRGSVFFDQDGRLVLSETGPDGELPNPAHGDPGARTPGWHGAGGLPRYKLRRITEHIHSRIGAGISLAELAAVAGVSRFHFHRQFSRAMGMTPQRYVQQLRIERAKVLLLQSGLAVGAVANAVGFAAQSHFCHTFRKITATTPSRYRNAMSR